MSVEYLLHEEICDQINEIHKLAVGSEESEKAISGACKLIDKSNDIARLKLEQDKIENDRVKNEIEKRRVESEEHDRKIKNYIVISTTATGVIVTVGMGLLAYVYEERGTITSKAGRVFVDKGLNYLFKK